MNYLGVILLILYLLYAIYIQIKQILIGLGIKKDKRFTDEKDLRRIYYKGIIGLIIEILIILYFVLAVLL